MKKAFLMIVFCAGTVMLFAQQQQRRYPPTSVERSWQRDYPQYNNNNNNDEPWEWRNNRWHRRFRDRDRSDRYVDVYYDRYGRRVYTMREWDQNEIPVRVRERIRNRYRTENYNVYRVERPGRGIYFQITLGNNRQVFLDERGREIRHYY